MRRWQARSGADATDPNLPIPTARVTVDASATVQLWDERVQAEALLTGTARLRGEASVDVGSGAWDLAMQLAQLEVPSAL